MAWPQSGTFPLCDHQFSRAYAGSGWLLQPTTLLARPLVLALALLLGAGRALGRRLEHRPLHSGDALLEARHTHPREGRRRGERRRDRVERARRRVVVDGRPPSVRKSCAGKSRTRDGDGRSRATCARIPRARASRCAPLAPRRSIQARSSPTSRTTSRMQASAPVHRSHGDSHHNRRRSAQCCTSPRGGTPHGLLIGIRAQNEARGARIPYAWPRQRQPADAAGRAHDSLAATRRDPEGREPEPCFGWRFTAGSREHQDLEQLSGTSQARSQNYERRTLRTR